MKIKLKKALELLQQAQKNFDRAAKEYDDDKPESSNFCSSENLETLAETFLELKSARKNYYSLLAKEKNWSEEELSDHLKTPAKQKSKSCSSCDKTSK